MTDFEKIDNWIQINAERIGKFSLQQPASNEQIQELEQLIGQPLPQDFKRLYQWHNGLNDEENFGSLFFGMDFFSIDGIIAEFNYRQQNAADENIVLKTVDKGINPLDIYNPNWLKFAFDGAHTGLYLDLSPTAEGTYGQILFIDDEYEIGILVADSTNKLVSDFANDLEANLYSLDAEALDDGNHYLEADSTIDIVNWQDSEKWNRIL